MPDIQIAPVAPYFDLEREAYIRFGHTISDNQAISLVTGTFGSYDSARRSEEERWKIAERLYFGVVPERVWEGTKKKRASLAVPIVYDQVEAAFPALSEALFEYYPTFFDVEAINGTDPGAAAQVRDKIAEYLESPYDETFLTAMPHMEMILKQGEIYGDGFGEISWDAAGKRFIVEFVDIRDIYKDPKSAFPLVDLSPAVIRRKMMSVQALQELRGTSGVRIPSDAILNGLAKSSQSIAADPLRQHQASAAKMATNAELSPDPRHQEIEVLQYWAKDRIIWLLGRAHCAINEVNSFGFLPFMQFPFTVVPGRGYSMSMADSLEGDQKYAQGIRNGRIDNLALGLTPPRIRARGTPDTPGATAWAPGLEDRVSSVDQVSVVKVENMTSDAYREEQIIHDGAAKRFGVNAMAQTGVPTPSNANRSATGVSAQAGATNKRLRPPVKNFEDFFIVPMLNKAYQLLKKFAADQLPQGEVKFLMKAASRMVAKDRLMQVMGPITQTLFSPVIMEEAHKQGQTLDFSTWQRFMQDATATSHSYNFFRAMNPNEQQAMQQPDPATMAKMQSDMQSNQTRMQLGQLKAQTEQAKIDADTQTKTAETGEKSAREILKAILAREIGKSQVDAAAKKAKDDRESKINRQSS